MFWCKKNLSILVIIAVLAGCESANKAPDMKKAYFDIRGFFDSEAARLQSKSAFVTKTVADNSETESKKVGIENWKNELALFAESDINKPSWKDSYRIDQKKHTVTYTSLEPDLRTRKIVIEKTNGAKVARIRISNKSDNLLYSSEEELDYFPDSLYRIIKFQKIKILGPHRYTIEGRF